VTYDEFEAEVDTLIYALRAGEISEDEYFREMEALASQWEDEGEE